MEMIFLKVQFLWMWLSLQEKPFAQLLKHDESLSKLLVFQFVIYEEIKHFLSDKQNNQKDAV